MLPWNARLHVVSWFHKVGRADNLERWCIHLIVTTGINSIFEMRLADYFSKQDRRLSPAQTTDYSGLPKHVNPWPFALP
jgi:hypothetical protein